MTDFAIRQSLARIAELERELAEALAHKNAYEGTIRLAQRYRERAESAESALATARRDALEEAAKVCREMQDRKNAKVVDGSWKSLGTNEIGGHTFAAAILDLLPDDGEPHEKDQSPWDDVDSYGPS